MFRCFALSYNPNLRLTSDLRELKEHRWNLSYFTNKIEERELHLLNYSREQLFIFQLFVERWKFVTLTDNELL